MISMKRHKGWIAVNLTILCLLTTISVASAEDELSFHFDPPDSTSFTELLRHTKTVSAPGVFPPSTQVSEQKGRYLIRKTRTGYSVVVTPILPALRLSEGTEGIMRSMFSIAVLTYYLNAEGQLVRVGGIEAVMDRLKEMVPQELMQAFLSSLGQVAEDPAQLAANMWTSRGMLGTLAGRTVNIDRVYQEAADVPLPIGGSIAGTIEMKISWPTPCSGKHCATVESTFESEDETIGERLGLMLNQMVINTMKMIDPSIDEEQIPDFHVTESSTSLENVRLVDPATGLIYSEKETRTLQALFGVGTEEKSAFIAKEIFEYTYEY